jgi:hypothetical protein
MIYLRDRQFDRAMAIFEKLAKQGDDLVELRAFGLAGKCVVLSIQHKHDESREVFSQFWPIRAELKHRPMAELVVQAVKKNRSELGTQGLADWEEWFDEQFREDN